VIAVAAFALRRVDDFDTWWHLAAGRWIAEARTVPWTDTLSFTVPDHEWINLQWLFDLAIYGLWQIGGADILVVASVLAFGASAYFLSRTLQTWIAPLPSALLVGWMAAMANERFTVRPEMATFPLLALTWWLIARARTEDGRNLWMLVPLFWVWANCHSLFILGLGVVGSHMLFALCAEHLPLPHALKVGSAWPEVARKRLWRWGSAAVLVTVINPYGYHALLFPLELFTRISGSKREVFSAIGEFRGPWSGYFPTFALGAYQAFFLVACVILALALLVSLIPSRRAPGDRAEGERGLDLAALAIFAVLAYLSVLARRNVGVFAVGALPVLAQALRFLWDRVPSVARLVGLRVGSVFALAVPVATAVLVWAVATNIWYAQASEQHEFGFGVFEENFPIGAVDFFVEHDLPGPVFNDMTAGGYLTWAQPSPEGVYIDGRLEVYDPDFFSAYMDSLRDPKAWLAEADRLGINSVLLFHRWGNRDRLATALMRHPNWLLVYFDEVAIVLVNTSTHRDKAVAAARAFNEKVGAEVRERMLAPASGRGWGKPLAKTIGLFSYSRVLNTMGDTEGAIEAFQAILKLDLAGEQKVAARRGLGLILARAGRLQEARFQLEQGLLAVPNDPGLLNLLARVDQALSQR
jgi:tetratricopeptide (TPR) repeat protein